MTGEAIWFFIGLYLLHALMHASQVQHLKIVAMTRHDPLHRAGIDVWAEEHESFYSSFAVFFKTAGIVALIWFGFASAWWYPVLLWLSVIPLGVILLTIVNVFIGVRRVSMSAFILEPLIIVVLFMCLLLGGN